MSKSYYIIDLEGNQLGPIEFSELSNHRITRETLVWCQGMPEWIEASQVPELESLVLSTPPPRPSHKAHNNMTPPPNPQSSSFQNVNPDFGNPQYSYNATVNAAPNTPQNAVPNASPNDIPNTKPESYFVWSILATVMCCAPLGIVSIVYASKVDKLWAAGLYVEAKSASDTAKMWLIICVACGFLSMMFGLIAVAAG